VREPRPSGGTGPGGRSRHSGALVRERRRTRGMHRHLRARRRRDPPWVSGAGTRGGCHRRAGRGKSDASRGHGTGRGRPVADRDGRGALPGSAGAAGPRRGDSACARPGDTGRYSRRGPDRRRDRGRRAARTTGRRAAGGSPWPRGPGDGWLAVDRAAGVCDNSGKPPTPPVGWVCPRARRFQLWALTFSPPGSRHPTRKLVGLPLGNRLGVQIPTGSGEHQHRRRFAMSATATNWGESLESSECGQGTEDEPARARHDSRPHFFWKTSLATEIAVTAFGQPA
jgi:hypothetical protein